MHSCYYDMYQKVEPYIENRKHITLLPCNSESEASKQTSEKTSCQMLAPPVPTMNIQFLCPITKEPPAPTNTNSMLNVIITTLTGSLLYCSTSFEGSRVHH